MKTLDEVLKNSLTGLHYGNRILLPFKVDILKAIIENDIITDFSSLKKGAGYCIKDEFTELYFYDYEILADVVSEHEKIKLVVVEKGNDIFDFANHRKISLHVGENHKLLISEINDDTLFIE